MIDRHHNQAYMASYAGNTQSGDRPRRAAPRLRRPRGARRGRPRAGRRRDAGRARPQRRRQDDAAADPGDAAAAERRRGRPCSAARCRARPGSCAARSATSATNRCSTATSPGARTCASTPACTGSPAPTAEARIAELLAAAGMERRGDERVVELSAGMRQRLAICRCVLHRAGAAAARRARLQPRRRGPRAGPRADRPRRRASPASSSPTTPSASCPRPTRC